MLPASIIGDPAALEAWIDRAIANARTRPPK
jgi:hypothetical protein